MMAANWTAVRRRLTVRRTSHRPPRGGRQAGHGSIVAPLAATLVASVAVGVGVALAQAERTRRAAKAQRARERRFASLPGEPLSEGLRRMTLGQLDLAIELLGGESAGEWALDKKTIHETRKALKRLRALVRLLREELGERQFRREHEILRDAAQRLAGARDAEVMVDTLDALLERHPRKLGRRRPLIELRKLLVAERTVAALQTLGDQATRGEVLRELSGLRERAQRWELPERPGIAIVENDLRRVYRQGRARMRLLARGKGGAHASHEWRKRVKDLRYAAEILHLRPLAHRADELGEVLGEEHDLVVLAGLLPPPGRAPFKGKRDKRARKALLKRIARRRRQLRKRALRKGERLYRRTPKKFLRSVRSAHRRASRI
jgi:CHAD domain-containing protein